jgi:hypothetical protein
VLPRRGRKSFYCVERDHFRLMESKRFYDSIPDTP